MYNIKTIVVGTTDDYIQFIHNVYNSYVLFITDISIREEYPNIPTNLIEIVSDLSNINHTLLKLDHFLTENKININGIVAFDCESLELASIIAGIYKLDFPSLDTVKNCRDKYRQKKILETNNIQTPKTEKVRADQILLDTFQEYGQKCVLKPIAGSGSELNYLCTTEVQCKRSYEKILSSLKQRKNNRLFSSDVYEETPIIIEEYIEGKEFSCDFIREGNEIFIIRIAEKIKSDKLPFGLCIGYKLVLNIEDISLTYLTSVLLSSSLALNLENVICMVDIIINENGINILELTPRPGGDCLPFLLDYASGHNTITSAVEYSSSHKKEFINHTDVKEYTALKLYAESSGVLEFIDTAKIKNYPNLIDTKLIRSPGDNICLPPDDYDSWCLGYVFIPSSTMINAIYDDLHKKITVRVI